VRVLVLTAMYPSAERPAAGTFVKQQVESLLAAGIDVEVQAFDGAGSLKNYVRAGLEVRRRLRHEHFDLVHAHYGLTGLPACMQTKAPVVITYHGSDLLGEVDSAGNYTFRGRLKVLLGQILGRRVKERIVVASVLQRRLWGRSATVIPMGVDLEAFTPIPRAEARRRLDLPPDRRTVLFVANPANGVKRFDVAEAAVARLAEAGHLVDLLPVFKARHDEIPVYMSACDVLVLTSNHEASPCVVKEALACNLPIVSVDVGDVAERIDGVQGCYLCRRSPEDVAAKLAIALSFAGRTDGRQKVQEISLANTARSTIEVFSRALGPTADS